MKTILSIAGSDCSGGAGIQADIKTITSHKLYAMSVITALTAQNTTGVYGIMDVSPDFVGKQLDCIFTDIRPDAVKIGMVSNAEIIKKIAQKLVEYSATNIVVDPVMISTSGSKLLSDDAIYTLKKYLLPLADIITPNIPEAEVLFKSPIQSKEDMLSAAQYIANEIGKSVLIKGGHFDDCADDLLVCANSSHWFEAIRVDNNNTHGTGCTLSSAIACNLALNYSLEDSIHLAKSYITNALKDGLNLGKGNGPLNHCHNMF